jgi:hypothetical protein
MMAIAPKAPNDIQPFFERVFGNHFESRASHLDVTSGDRTDRREIAVFPFRLERTCRQQRRRRTGRKRCLHGSLAWRSFWWRYRSVGPLLPSRNNSSPRCCTRRPPSNCHRPLPDRQLPPKNQTNAWLRVSGLVRHESTPAMSQPITVGTLHFTEIGETIHATRC